MFLLEYFGRDGMKFPGQPGGMALVGGETPTWCKTMVIRNGLDGEMLRRILYRRRWRIRLDIRYILIGNCR